MTAPQPLLAGGFRALTDAGISWMLLRGAAELADPRGDVDLLLAAPDLAAAEGALREAGFVRIPVVRRGSHVFFLGYSPDDGRWLRLDVVTRLEYGDGHALRTGMARACLARRRDVDGVPQPGRDDAFWTLLLHAVLDKRRTGAARWCALRELARGAAAETPWMRVIARLLPEVDGSAIVATVAGGDPADLDRLAGTIRAAFRRRFPRARRRARVDGALQWTLEAPRRALERPGLSVTLLGPDGAGKSTVAAAVAARSPFPSRTVYMGLWKHAYPAATRVPGADLATRLAIAWRAYLTGRWHRVIGRLVIFDRYTFDALLGRGRPLARRQRLYLSIVARSCPAPDLVVLLDAPGAVAFRRKGEHDAAHLDRDRMGFLALAATIRGAVVVDADRPVADVTRGVEAAIWRQYLERWP